MATRKATGSAAGKKASLRRGGGKAAARKTTRKRAAKSPSPIASSQPPAPAPDSEGALVDVARTIGSTLGTIAAKTRDAIQRSTPNKK